jgi:hypothetical protein
MKLNNFFGLCAIVFALIAPTFASAASDKNVVGQWKDDKYSEALNAEYDIFQADGVYYLHRSNSDGSEGSYPLKKVGNKYIKLGDKFGAYYVVSPEGLKIYDQMGHIRTAKPR